MRMHQVWRRTSIRIAAPIGAGLSALTMACSDPTSAGTSVPVPVTDAQVAATTIQCDRDNAGLKLPAGFCALAVVKNVGRARHMAVRPNGDVYVAIDNTPGTADGGILALRDADGDGRPEIQQRFGDIGGNGIAWEEGQLYFAPNDRVIRYSFTGDELVPTAPPDVIVSGLPVGGDHQRKTVVL